MNDLKTLPSSWSGPVFRNLILAHTAVKYLKKIVNKVKSFTLEQATKTQRWRRDIALLFL